MERLVLQLRSNQKNLDKMRIRLQCVRSMATEYESDYLKQNGAYAAEWDEWYDWVQADRSEFQADVYAIKQFIDDLRNYLIACQAPAGEAPTNEASNDMMQSLADEMIQCETDMLTRMDEHIRELREFAHSVAELETNDHLLD